jgi:hypothetical protein
MKSFRWEKSLRDLEGQLLTGFDKASPIDKDENGVKMSPVMRVKVFGTVFGP